MEKKTEFKELEDRIISNIDWGKSCNIPAKFMRDFVVSAALLCIVCGWIYYDYDSEWARSVGYFMVVAGVGGILGAISIRIIQVLFAFRVLMLVKKLPESHPLAKKIYKDSEEAWEEYND